MADSNSAMIYELIESPDNVETVRDQIAAVLSLEIQNQLKLASEAKKKDLNPYKIPVFVENGRPYTASGDKPLMRLVNVTLAKTVSMNENARIGNQKEQATFFIDCIACGNDTGNFRDDRSASFRAWSVMRIVRRIIMSDAYMYLGMRGVVGSRIIVSMEAGTPGIIDGDSALAYVVIRAEMNVQFIECSVSSEMETLEGIDFEIDPESGELTANTGGK